MCSAMHSVWPTRNSKERVTSALHGYSPLHRGTGTWTKSLDGMCQHHFRCDAHISRDIWFAYLWCVGNTIPCVSWNVPPASSYTIMETSFWGRTIAWAKIKTSNRSSFPSPARVCIYAGGIHRQPGALGGVASDFTAVCSHFSPRW